jgi:DnaJ-class molecular chaperone
VTVPEDEMAKGKAKIITCAFCQGTGKDSFGIMSPLSSCQVCGGKGLVTIREPALACAFCGGSGVHDEQRLTCTACRGKGMVSIVEPVEKCPRCQGTGMDIVINYLPCVLCGGKGVITAKKREKQLV